MQDNPILVFDTYAGLCNQMYDIRSAIHFCIHHNYLFSFRNASFRNPQHLAQWFDVPFEQLFHADFFEKYSNYIPIYELQMTKDNTFNYDGSKRSIELFYKDKELVPQINKVYKKYVILKQFWSIYNNYNDSENIYKKLMPSLRIQHLYNGMKLALPSPYNYIHYRYEKDFLEHFKISDPVKLSKIIEHFPFQKKDLPVYIAASNVNLMDDKQLDKPIHNYKNILLKREILNLNFEEAAFLDFLIGKEAIEIVGHSYSSFTGLLNSMHKTTNHYNSHFQEK